jgi:hypothetical protein
MLPLEEKNNMSIYNIYSQNKAYEHKSITTPIIPLFDKCWALGVILMTPQRRCVRCLVYNPSSEA